MRILLSFMFVIVFANADVYYAKVEPFENYSIKSAVSGLVTKSKLNLEGKFIQNNAIVKIDDATNIQDLKTSEKKLQVLENMKKIIVQSVKNAKVSYVIKKRNYDRIKNLKTKSIFEKDNELIATIASQNQYLSSKQNEQNIKMQIDDLKYKIFALKDMINKKTIIIKNRYLYKLYVKKGDFVNPGSLLAQVEDVSKAKLIIYLSYQDMLNINKKTIFINGKPTKIKFYKIWKIADSVNISSYKAEIIIPSVNVFSQVVKIELK